MRLSWFDELTMTSAFIMRSTALTSVALLLALILGILLGRILWITSQPVPLTVLREDHRSLIPVVRIDGIENGELTGVSHGDVRLFLGEQVIMPNGSGAFRVPAGNLLKNVAVIPVPAGMNFVASRRGKKYYPVASPSAAKLSPANRIYFRDAQAAERAGYQLGGY